MLTVLAYCFANKNEERVDENKYFPTITVLLTVYNEENKVIDRLKNILNCFYPSDKLKVVVVSDGSTDNTNSLVQNFDSDIVKLIVPTQGSGKTAAQNFAIKFIESELIVFTDADTIFDPSFLEEVVQPFKNKEVGGVDGRVLFTSDNNKNISESQGYYWKQELNIRNLESKLGILAVSSGPSLTIRKNLFQDMNVTVGDDCVIPLDIVSQGFKMHHCRKAIAYDQMDNTLNSELKTRARMTQRNWEGTWMYPKLLNPFLNLSYSFSLWSHKLLRWLSPIFFINVIISSIIMELFYVGLFYKFLTIPILLFFLISIFGAVSSFFQKDIKIVGTAWSFCLANIGFSIGLYKTLTNSKITKYK